MATTRARLVAIAMKRSRATVTDDSDCATTKSEASTTSSKAHVKARHNHRPLTNRLSKSHDNLASVLRRKAAVTMLAGNKENVERDLTSSVLSAPRSKTPKIADALIRKSQSTHDIDHCDEPLQRTQSVHNICMAPGSQLITGPASVKKTDKNVVPRRSASTRNIDQKGGVQLRISVPPNMMAYNAELLASFEKEKKAMERRISELIQVAESRKTEIEKLKFAVKNLTEAPGTNDGGQRLEQLLEENILLKNKLMADGVSVEHFTDSEKLSLLHGDGGCGDTDDRSGVNCEIIDDDTANKPESDENKSDDVMTLADVSSLTAEHPSPVDNSAAWERLSANCSEAPSDVAVADLQDRINQMEETHYSTNEELQATLQELTDLQQTVNSLTEENEQLGNEKSVLLASLCAQTEKLENCRMQIAHMKAILMSDITATADSSENERLLVELIRGAEIEKEEMVLRQMSLMHTMQLVESENRESQDAVVALLDKVAILDMKHESLRADKRAAETTVGALRETLATNQIETQRYRTLLENERTKVAELEQSRNTTDRSEVEELLDNSRQDKEKLEVSGRR